jgi:hypothetical protein
MPAKQASNVYSANLTHSFSPTLTNEFVFADATFINPIALTNAAAVDPSKVGFHMTGLFKDNFTPQVPNTTNWAGVVPGYLAPTFGQTWQGGDFGKLSQAPNVSDNITKVVGTHTLKAGFYWDFARNQQTSSNYTGAPQGVLDIENYGFNTTGNALADFATGRINQFIQSNAAPVQDFKYHQYSFFFNDQWKTTRRLTLTLGVRFDHMGQWTGGPNGLAVWDPYSYNGSCTDCAYTGLKWHAIDPSIPLSGFPSKPFFIEPRFGMAYDVFGNGKTVVRGGFGVYRYQLSYNTASEGFGAPNQVVQEGTTNGCCIGYNSFNLYSPSLGAAGLGSAVNALQMGDNKTPYTESYNFTISQRTPWNSVAEFQYSGNQSHDLLGDSALTNQDLIPLGTFFKPDPITGHVVDPTASGFNANDYYPYHQYTGIQVVEHNNYQYYNAFVATWQKQTGKTTFTTNYTFSKVLGIRDGNTGNGGGNGALLDPYSNSANYGVLAYDHTHIFNAAYVINLPSPVHSNVIAKGFVNGWELSGITQLQSGAPIQPNSPNGTLNLELPGGSQYSNSSQLGTNSMNILPLLTCDPRSGLKSGQYFNPSCFTLPTGGANGNIIWPYIHGPAFFNSDLSLYKNFAIGEHQKIQFRFEAFNFLNHPLEQFGLQGNNDLTLNFSGANNTASTTNVNAKTNGYPAFTTGRRVIEFALKYNF